MKYHAQPVHRAASEADCPAGRRRPERRWAMMLHAINVRGQRWFLEKSHKPATDDAGRPANVIVDPARRRIIVWELAPAWDLSLYIAEAVALIAADPLMGR